jgi:hypothetical protein
MIQTSPDTFMLVSETMPIRHALRLRPALEALHADVWLRDDYLTTGANELDEVSRALAIVARRIISRWEWNDAAVSEADLDGARHALASAMAARSEIEAA